MSKACLKVAAPCDSAGLLTPGFGWVWLQEKWGLKTMIDDQDEFPTTSGYVSDTDHKPLGVIAAGICVLVFIGILAAPRGEAPTPNAAIPRPTKLLAQISVEDENRVCRAAVAAIMGHDPSIMRSSDIYGTGRTVTYRRPSDGTKWTNKCSVNGNIVTIEGLMKPGTGYLEEELQFSLDQKSVTILHFIRDSNGALSEPDISRYEI